MKKIILILAVLITLMACSKVTEPKSFEERLTELCDDYGYGWKSTIDRDYYIPRYTAEPDRAFEVELDKLACDFRYAAASYPIFENDILVRLDYMVVVK
jgi:hypothetical protein